MTGLFLHNLLNRKERTSFSLIQCKCIHLQLYLNMEDFSKQFGEEADLPEIISTSLFLLAIY
jgi:heterodisulfide reductase subunit B